jgi:hypothetical protein
VVGSTITIHSGGLSIYDSPFTIYRVFMAIGWGKSFEEQVEEANQRASDRRAPKVPLEDRVREQRLKSLEVSRSRIEGQLNKAVHPAHRETLMKALQALLNEIDEVLESRES